MSERDKQKDLFLGGEGDAWFERNHAAAGQDQSPCVLLHCLLLLLLSRPVLEAGRAGAEAETM